MGNSFGVFCPTNLNERCVNRLIWTNGRGVTKFVNWLYVFGFFFLVVFFIRCFKIYLINRKTILERHESVLLTEIFLTLLTT